ncbi:MAG: type I-C CRISPR-associated endonuclease Cas1 [Polyangiaceae bacterium]|nr:type I-C CRISPR-associated endonuclease Cas1 [Polyangiaceae bacterium]
MSVHLNTLYVTTDGAYLSRNHDTVVVRVENEQKAQIPFIHISAVCCFGRVLMSPELMGALTEAGIHIAFFSSYGRFLARVEGLPGGNVLLRRAQHRAADNDLKSLSIARSVVIGKVVNTRQFLMHARRDAPTDERRQAIAAVCDRLSMHLKSIPDAPTVEVLRGLEGIAAKDYFSVFGDLIKHRDSAFTFEGRNRRPPKDRMNALLSFGYAVLLQDCVSAATGIGLDPGVGFLHEDRPGRLCLGLDLMEELRVPMVDRLMLSLVNRGQLAPNDFIDEPAGGIRLTDDARKTVLKAYQEMKMGEVQHAFLDQKVTWSRVPHIQALLLARTLRGDLDVYPPFALR